MFHISLFSHVEGVYKSDPKRLRKGGFAQINKLKSAMMNADNLDTRIGNQSDYHVTLYNKDDAHFLGFLYTANICAFAEGYIIDLLWGTYARPPHAFTRPFSGGCKQESTILPFFRVAHPDYVLV